MNLEEILQKWFHCKKPFLAHPHLLNKNGDKEYFTKKGGEAYSQLVDLLYAIGSLTETSDVMCDIVEILDDIVRIDF